MVVPGRGEENPSAFSVTQAQPEKRAGRRYPVVVPVIIRWKDAGDHEVSGILRDVNDHGIFFYAPANIPVGTQVDLTFTVPREVTAPEIFHFIGTLIRTEDSAKPEKGFAVVVSSSELLGQVQANQPLESVQVREVESQAPQARVEEQAEAESCGHPGQRRLCSMRVAAIILGVSLLLLACAAKAIMARQDAAHSRARTEQNIRVWIDPSTGLYHCPGSEWYGKKTGGKYVTQQQAHLDGFHPAYQRPCQVTSLGGDSATDPSPGVDHAGR